MATNQPEKSAGQTALESIEAIAIEMASGEYFAQNIEVLKANRVVLSKFIEIANTVRKVHDDLLAETPVEGYAPFRKPHAAKENPLKNLFK